MATPIAAAAVNPVEPTLNPSTKVPPIIQKVDSVMKDSNPAAAAIKPDGGVRVLGLHEYKAAALSIAEAFKDDEVSRYFVDTPDRTNWTEQQKWDLHVKIMEYITYAHLLKGLVVSAGPDYDCVGLW